MAIYIAVVPHQARPYVIVGEDEDDITSWVGQSAASSDQTVDTFDDAVEYALHDAHGGAVYMTDAAAVEALKSGAGLPEHQHIRALSALREALEQRDALPAGLTGESAYYANDGPDEQCRAELRAIINACDNWPTEAAARLKAEAEEFLAEREA